jgi:transmembrane sensor
MRSETPDIQRRQAIEWRIRLRDGDDATWDAFSEWLAQDPANAEAYDLVEQMDVALEPMLGDLVMAEAANDVGPPAARPSARPWPWKPAAAIAASVAVAVGLALHFAPSRYEVVTGAGERKVVSLDAATRVELNGSTRLTLDHRNARFAALASGEALFHVRHDDRRPFELRLGGERVVDVGTVFNVVRDADGVRVAVAEGKVVYSQGSRDVPLGRGQALVRRTGDAAIHLATIPAASVGGWRNGRLVYSGDPLAQVAADLSRSLGMHISVAPAIAERPVYGVIALDGSGPAQLDRLGSALNVALVHAGDSWTMTSPDSAKR